MVTEIHSHIHQKIKINHSSPVRLFVWLWFSSHSTSPKRCCPKIKTKHHQIEIVYDIELIKPLLETSRFQIRMTWLMDLKLKQKKINTTSSSYGMNTSISIEFEIKQNKKKLLRVIVSCVMWWCCNDDWDEGNGEGEGTWRKWGGTSTVRFYYFFFFFWSEVENLNLKRIKFRFLDF